MARNHEGAIYQTMANTQIKPREDRLPLAALIVLAAYLCFAVLDVSAKFLSKQIPMPEVVFVRYLGHFVAIIAIFGPLMRGSLVTTRSPRLEFARGVVLLVTTLLSFSALRYLSLTAYAAMMLTTPLMITGLSVPLLGEQVGWRRWAAIGVGFVGAMIVVRPGGDTLQWAALLALCGAFGGAIYSIIARKLAGVDAAATQMFYTSVIASVGSLPFALVDWQWPSTPVGWIAFFGVGPAGWAGHHLMTVAYRFAPASALTPFMYIQIVYMMIAGLLIYGDWPAVPVLIGAGFIVGSGLFVWYREAKLKRLTRQLIDVGAVE